jgi:hypothetical protein
VSVIDDLVANNHAFAASRSTSTSVRAAASSS